MNINNISPSPTPLIKLESNFLSEYKINFYVKRLDLNHPQISGNKWFKLFYNLKEARRIEEITLLTFGGAYSNHIYATASAGKEFGFKTIGLIRGEEHQPLNHTLKFAKNCGMELHYIDRTKYRSKNSTKFIKELKKTYGEFYLLHEGGTNSLAVKGCSEIINLINIDFNYICTPCGTGGTLAGLICGLNGKKNILGFSVLKGGGFLINDVINHIKNFNNKTYKNWDINLDYHFGGYAKTKEELLTFVKNFNGEYKISIEPIYTGKMFYGIFDLIKKNHFQRNTTIVVLHTGGMQN